MEAEKQQEVRPGEELLFLLLLLSRDTTQAEEQRAEEQRAQTKDYCSHLGKISALCFPELMPSLSH